jgi:hypothetical protein
LTPARPPILVIGDVMTDASSAQGTAARETSRIQKAKGSDCRISNKKGGLKVAPFRSFSLGPRIAFSALALPAALA